MLACLGKILLVACGFCHVGQGGRPAAQVTVVCSALGDCGPHTVRPVTASAVPQNNDFHDILLGLLLPVLTPRSPLACLEFGLPRTCAILRSRVPLR